MDVQIRDEAKNGNPAAQRKMGLYYLKADSIERDIPEGIKWIRKAAEGDDTVAQRILAMRYLRGDGLEKNYAQALLWIRIGVGKNDGFCQWMLSYCYKHGYGVEKDISQCLDWEMKAANNGDKGSQLDLGMRYLRGDGIDRDLNLAYKWIKQAANRGSLEAKFRLGLLMREHTTDINLAMELIHDAASKGNLSAQYYLGKYYDDKQDLAISKEWYIKAAENGHIQSQRALAKLYNDKDFEEFDKEKVFYWYLKAAEKGDMESQYKVAFSYELGIGVEVDMNKALHWYKKAADQGHPDSCTNIADKYSEGEVVAKDCNLALHYYTKATKEKGINSCGAEYSIGLLYQRGEIAPKHVNEAFLWFKKSALKGLLCAIDMVNTYELTLGIGRIEHHFPGWEFLNGFNSLNNPDNISFSWDIYADAIAALEKQIEIEKNTSHNSNADSSARPVPAPLWVRATIIREACIERYKLCPEKHEWKNGKAETYLYECNPLMFLQPDIPDYVLFLIIEDYIELLDKGHDQDQALSLIKSTAHERSLPAGVSPPNTDFAEDFLGFLEMFGHALFSHKDPRRTYELCVYIQVVLKYYGRRDDLIDYVRGLEFMDEFVGKLFKDGRLR